MSDFGVDDMNLSSLSLATTPDVRRKSLAEKLVARPTREGSFRDFEVYFLSRRYTTPPSY